MGMRHRSHAVFPSAICPSASESAVRCRNLPLSVGSPPCLARNRRRAPSKRLFHASHGMLPTLNPRLASFPCQAWRSDDAQTSADVASLPCVARSRRWKPTERRKHATHWPRAMLSRLQGVASCSACWNDGRIPAPDRDGPLSPSPHRAKPVEHAARRLFNYGFFNYGGVCCRGRMRSIGRPDPSRPSGGGIVGRTDRRAVRGASCCHPRRHLVPVSRMRASSTSNRPTASKLPSSRGQSNEPWVSYARRIHSDSIRPLSRVISKGPSTVLVHCDSMQIYMVLNMEV
ncbi:hypothetical protein Uis4E_1272 [Bifidobacterium parmae]|uniref:Uncharacterized protein n=1 Tax=Bifidobacterium parmae TaxID=361854 RepID=A0A2N5J362_9BIFI|nr:hypothetical protein Uis4E_1272 [Bifidobacterium parmae]